MWYVQSMLHVRYHVTLCDQGHNWSKYIYIYHYKLYVTHENGSRLHKHVLFICYVFQIPVIVVAPTRDLGHTIVKHSGYEIAFCHQDVTNRTKQWKAIVIAYNGLNHFVPTVPISQRERVQHQMQLMGSHAQFMLDISEGTYIQLYTWNYYEMITNITSSASIISRYNNT